MTSLLDPSFNITYPIANPQHIAYLIRNLYRSDSVEGLRKVDPSILSPYIMNAEAAKFIYPGINTEYLPDKLVMIRNALESRNSNLARLGVDELRSTSESDVKLVISAASAPYDVFEEVCDIIEPRADIILDGDQEYQLLKNAYSSGDDRNIELADSIIESVQSRSDIKTAAFYGALESGNVDLVRDVLRRFGIQPLDRVPKDTSRDREVLALTELYGRYPDIYRPSIGDMKKYPELIESAIIAGDGEMAIRGLDMHPELDSAKYIRIALEERKADVARRLIDRFGVRSSTRSDEDRKITEQNILFTASQPDDVGLFIDILDRFGINPLASTDELRLPGNADLLTLAADYNAINVVRYLKRLGHSGRVSSGYLDFSNPEIVRMAMRELNDNLTEVAEPDNWLPIALIEM